MIACGVQPIPRCLFASPPIKSYDLLIGDENRQHIPCSETMGSSLFVMVEQGIAAELLRCTTFSEDLWLTGAISD